MSLIWVGVGDLPGSNRSRGSRTHLNRLRTWTGSMGESNADDDALSHGDIDTAERFGRRTALITRSLAGGTPYQAERLTDPEFRQQNLRRKESNGETKH